jgi:hypothetical protein
MGRDHAPCERDVGEILAVGVEAWVRSVRRTAEREFLSADVRRREPVR